MEHLTFDYPAQRAVKTRAHVGVVGSGDLEVLLEPSPDQQAHVAVTTSVDGFGAVWQNVLDRFFERFDYWILATAHIFPFDAALDWPREIAGRPMETYHAWMKVVLPVTMCGHPVVAAPAGFGPQGLPIGIQIVGRNRAERDCLELAHAYDERTKWVAKHPPALLG